MMNTNLIAIAIVNLLQEGKMPFTPTVKQRLDELAGALQAHHAAILRVKELAAEVASPKLHAAVSAIADRSAIEIEMGAPDFLSGKANKTFH